MTDEEMLMRIGALRREATIAQYKEGLCNFKWEFGSNIIHKLESMFRQMYNVDDTEVGTLMGLPFEVNDKEKDMIKLWREVWI